MHMSPVSRGTQRPPHASPGAGSARAQSARASSPAWVPSGQAGPRSPSPPRRRMLPVFHLPPELRALMQQEAAARGRVLWGEAAARRRLHTTRALGLWRLRAAPLLGTVRLLRLCYDSTAAALCLRREELRHRREIQLRFAESFPSPPPTPARTPPTPPPPRTATPEGSTAELGRTQRRAVLRALVGSSGCCEEKQKENRAAPSGKTAAEMAALAHWLVAEWHRKPGTVLDELLANLRAPEEIEAAPELKVQVLALAAEHLAKNKGHHYRGACRIELVAMLLYTMAGPDIDALMTFADVPDYDTQRAAWSAYQSEKSPQRNGAIFGAINWAMRTAGAPPPVPCPEGSDTAQFKELRRWVKYITLLLALASKEGGAASATLARGLAGLPDHIVAEHAALQKGAAFCWPAASSCAFDRSVSEAYIRGEAANATKQSGGGVLFLLRKARWGLHLQNISKYPKEAELLLPPLTEFVVDSVEIAGSPARQERAEQHGAHGAGRPLPAGTVLVNASLHSVLGSSELGPLCAASRTDALRASRLLRGVARRMSAGPAAAPRRSTLRLHTAASFLRCSVPDSPVHSWQPRPAAAQAAPPSPHLTRDTAASAARRGESPTCPRSPEARARSSSAPAPARVAQPQRAAAPGPPSPPPPHRPPAAAAQALPAAQPAAAARRTAAERGAALARLQRPTAAAEARRNARLSDLQRLRGPAR
eukprot:TRINITY_DN2852_c0_g2_i1.p1 TRINITY_DN2852_c0_g2~~TRINITY_DN2852_c0_g2_i1.p1  ORF type:complete len:708 (+),score=170.69 TRINITY_DN2852_c0_g2_i1:69-2192(+)